MNNKLIDLDAFKIFEALSAQNLQINPFYIKITGSLVGGYLLTQLVYLFRSYDYQEFYQKDGCLRDRLLLSEWELKTQKKELVRLGLINIRIGLHKVTHYTINIEKIINLAVDNNTKLSSIKAESSDLKKRNPPIYKSGILRYIYKEENTKQTTLNKNTKHIINGNVDNSKGKAADAAVPFESALDFVELPTDRMSHVQIEMAEIEGMRTSTIKHFITIPEYIAVDILRSYRKNASKVRDVNKYFLGAAKNRLRNDRVA